METVYGVRGLAVRLRGDRTPLIEPNWLPLLRPTQYQTHLRSEKVFGSFALVLAVRHDIDRPQARPQLQIPGVRLHQNTT